MVELISPHDKSLPSVVTKMVEKQPCTPYHICIKVNDVDAEIKRLKDKGFRRTEKVLTNNVYGYQSKGVFLFHKEIGLIEIVEK